MGGKFFVVHCEKDECQLGLVTELFHGKMDAVRYDLQDYSCFGAETGHIGLILLGCAEKGCPCESANEDTYLIHREWIRRAIGHDIPVLGICQGAQLIAKVLGSDPQPLKRRQSGPKAIELDAAAPESYSGLLKDTRFYQNHKDYFLAPSGVVPLAFSRGCAQRHCEAFHYNGTVHAYQFHADFNYEWLSMVNRYRSDAERQKVAERNRALLTCWKSMTLCKAIIQSNA